MKFLLQTIQGESVFKIQHDFVFELSHALKYYEWKGENIDKIYCTLEDINLDLNKIIDVKNYVPVGTIEFVMKFIDTFIKKDGSKEIKPTNLPESLFDVPYSERYVDNFEINPNTRQQVFDTLSDWICDDLVFVKSNDMFKSPITDFYNKKDILDYNKIPDGNYQISESVNIESEWRCFIYKGELVGIQYYSGDFTVYPNIENINEMIHQIVTPENINAGLTLDVAVTSDNKTIAIEVHEFFSCGLYGFSDYKILPYMFYRTFQNIKRRLQ